MPCGACGCYCNAGGEAAREQLLGTSSDLEDRSCMETTAEESDPAVFSEIMFGAAQRITLFIVRGLFILLWLNLYNSMRRCAINYIGEDSRFSMFAVIAIAVPVVEFLCIVDQVRSFGLRREFGILLRRK